MTIMKVKQQDGTIVNVPLGGQTIVDQTYSATSTNAQSGIAVAQAIEQALGDLPSGGSCDCEEKLNSLTIEGYKRASTKVDITDQATVIEKSYVFGKVGSEVQIQYGENYSWTYLECTLSEGDYHLRGASSKYVDGGVFTDENNIILGFLAPKEEVTNDGTAAYESYLTVPSGSVYTLYLNTIPSYGLNGTIVKSINDNTLSFIRSESGGTSCNCDSVPDYVKEEAAEVADKIISTRTVNSLVLLMATDLHVVAGSDPANTPSGIAIKHMGQGMNEIRKYIEPDGLVLLGDYNYGSSNPKSEAIKAMKCIKQSVCDVSKGLLSIWMNGNHDTYVTSGENRLTDGETYALVGANNSPNTIVDADNLGRNYGYVDFNKQRIRLIYLNTTDVSGGVESSNFISGYQYEWLKDTLLDVNTKNDAEKWGIIVCSHFPIHMYAWDTASQWYGNEIFRDLKAMLCAYKDKSGGSVAKDTIHNKDGFSYDFSNAKSELIATFHGHIHNFKVHDVTTDGGNIIKAISIPNACQNRENPYGEVFREVDENGNPVSYPKTAGTAEDTSFNAVVIDRENKKIYAYCYGAGYDREISYDDEVVTTIYNIENNLTNCSNSNVASTIQGGSAYNATITANSGYTLESVNVTMGGSAVSVTDGVISIASVTGDIVITATAEETGGDEPETPTEVENLIPLATDASGAIYGGDYNGDGVNDGYKTSTRIGSDGTDRSSGNHCATGFIPITVGDKLYFENCQIDTTISTTSTYNEIHCFNADKVLLSPTVFLWEESRHTTHEFTVDENNCLLMFDTQTLPVGTAFVRISGKYIGADSIITINEPTDETPITYTNQIPLSIDAGGNIYGEDYNGDGVADGYKVDTYVSSSGGTAGSRTGVNLTGFIPIEGVGSSNFAEGEIVVYLKNIEAVNSNSNVRLGFYNANKEYIVYQSATHFNTVREEYGRDILYTADENNYITSIDLSAFTYFISTSETYNYQQIAYFRICAPGLDGDSIITVNQPIE